MRIRKSTLKRIIAEATGRLISEKAYGRDAEALAPGATPSIEDLDKLIKKKRETIESMEGYRLMDPSIEDAIDAEMDTLNKLGLLSKKLRKERDSQ
jgi:hypothetical protein